LAILLVLLVDVVAQAVNINNANNTIIPFMKNSPTIPAQAGIYFEWISACAEMEACP
jgi:hypothetical protein